MFLVEAQTPKTVVRLEQFLVKNQKLQRMYLIPKGGYIFVEDIECDNFSVLRKTLKANDFSVWLIAEKRNYGERFVYEKKTRGRTGKELYNNLIKMQ